MTPSSIQRMSCRWFWTPVLVGLAALSSGCATMQVPALKLPSLQTPKLSDLTGLTAGGGPGESERYQSMGSGSAMTGGTFTEQVYHKVREAKASESIVLQIVGDSAPIRVLPLPPASGGGTGAGQGRSVFVSTLLQQTKVADRLGNIEAALYRHSADSVEGVRMDVQFVPKSRGEVRPESDYALRAGDRLVVREATRGGLGSLVDLALQR